MLRLDIVGRHLGTLDPVEPVPPVLLDAHDVKSDDEQLLLLTELADVGLRQLDDDGVVLIGDVEPGWQFNRKNFDLSFSLISGLRFHVDSGDIFHF